LDPDQEGPKTYRSGGAATLQYGISMGLSSKKKKEKTDMHLNLVKNFRYEIRIRVLLLERQIRARLFSDQIPNHIKKNLKIMKLNFHFP
jgi:hypothetical protein